MASVLVEEVKESFFDDVLVARVYGERVFLELHQFPSATPELRVKRRDAQSIKHLLNDLYPGSGGGLRCVRGCWSGWNRTSVKDRGHRGIHGRERKVYEEIYYRYMQGDGRQRPLCIEVCCWSGWLVEVVCAATVA